MPRTRGSICSSARSARTRWATSAARFATKGRGAPRRSSGRRTRRTSAARRPVEEGAWLVQQPPLDLSDAAGAVRREQLPEVPSRSDRACEPSERFPDPPAPQADGRATTLIRRIRLLRLPRDQRLSTGPNKPSRTRSASGTQLLCRCVAIVGQPWPARLATRVARGQCRRRGRQE